MSILEELAKSSQEQVKLRKSCPGKSYKEVAQRAVEKADVELLNQKEQKFSFPFYAACAHPGLSFICEVKRASPSRGLIAPDFNHTGIAQDYEVAGADAISVLTEHTRFLGSEDYLADVVRAQTLPVLRKDFIIDDYMIYEAKVLGASAVLLICTLLDEKTLANYLALCHSLGLSALVEAHTRDEIDQACLAGAKIIGINNRNLHDFSVNTQCTSQLAQAVPDGVLLVSESGITQAQDVRQAFDAQADAVLIGEALMRAKDKKQKLCELKSLLPHDAQGHNNAQTIEG